MRYLFGFLCVCALGVMPLVGCSETADDGGSGGSAGSGGMGGTVDFSLTTYEGDGWELGPPLEGVEVCETGTTNCTTSDVNGQARLLLPANREISYSLMKDGYMPWIVGDVTDETFQHEGFPTLPMYPNEQIAVFAQSNMIPYPLTGGALLFHMNPLNTAGVTYDLVDEMARQYYSDLDEDQVRIFRFDLTATTSDGFGGFFEVPPGDHQVEFGGTATNCTVALAWPGDAPNRVKVPVEVGFFTLASMNCDVQ